MRYYEWKVYKDTIVKPVLSKCYHHELHSEANGLISDIDRGFRLIGYTKSTIKINQKQEKLAVFRRELDQKWLEHDIRSKIAYLKDLLLVIRLGT